MASWEAFPQIPPGQSGRLQLPHWLADKRNPLTARVVANRVWQKLIGEGLVRSVDYFGARGEEPSHPELLDDLATRGLAFGPLFHFADNSPGTGGRWRGTIDRKSPRL